MFYSGVLYAKSRQVIISAAFPGIGVKGGKEEKGRGGGKRKQAPSTKTVRKILGTGFPPEEIYDSSASARDGFAGVRNASWH